MIVRYQDQGAVTRRFLATDERGSVIAMSDDTGNVTAISAYDEYGQAQAQAGGAKSFTGQGLDGNFALYNYKARYYSPQLGRFMQTDPIGYAGDGPNLYAYVLDDPVNFVDPLGLSEAVPGATLLCGPNEFWDELSQSCSITVTGSRNP